MIYKNISMPKVISRSQVVNSGKPNFFAGQCDCACSSVVETGTSIRNIRLYSDIDYHCNPEMIRTFITEGFQTVCVPKINTFALLNHNALALMYHFAQPHNLNDISQQLLSNWDNKVLNDTLQKFVDLRLLVHAMRSMSELLETPSVLIAWLHLTTACNLRCAYCYLDAAPEPMSSETARQAIDSIFRSATAHHFSGVKLKYAGGEPTLNFSLIVEMHRYAQELADRHNLDLDGVILTNGVNITPKMTEAIKALNLRVAVSLDGLGDYHDCQRPCADGSGSFAAIEHSLDYLQAQEIYPHISITISGHNVAGLPDLVAWLLDRDLTFSFNLYRENARSANNQDLRFDEDQLISGILTAYKIIEERLPYYSLLGTLADRANLAISHTRPYAAGRNYLVIDQRGRIAKCQMQIDHPVTTINAPDPLAVIRESTDGLQNPSIEDKDECRECEWRYWCAGGCPLEAHRVTGRYNAKFPNCNIYKVLFPEVMRLEGLRLLKYANTEIQ